jgi:hypothetical protein
MVGSFSPLAMLYSLASSVEAMAKPSTCPALKAKSRLNESRKTLCEISVFESMVTDLNLTFGFESTEFIIKFMFNYSFQILNDQTGNWFNGVEVIGV